MRILSISTDKKILEAGSVVQARMLEYAELFDELHIIVFSSRFSSMTPLRLGTSLWVYPTRSLNRWFYVFDAIRVGRGILKNRVLKSDFVIDTQDPFECGFVGLWLSKHLGMPLRVQIHTDFLSPFFAQASLLNRIRVRLAKFILPKASGIRVVSQRIADSLSQIGECVAPITVLPIFTDFSKLQVPFVGTGLSEQYPQWHFIALAVSRLESEKNITSMLRIIARIAVEYPFIGLVIVGKGSCAGRLMQYTRELGIEKNVAFVGEKNDLLLYYKTANLFLQTSLYEGFGLSLLEAVSAGLPTVSSDVGIAPLLLNGKGHSFVCPVNDENCFVEKIVQLMKDNELRKFLATQIPTEALDVLHKTKVQYLAEYKASLERVAISK